MKAAYILSLLYFLSIHATAQRVHICDTSNQWEYTRHYDAGQGHKFKYEWTSYNAGDTLVSMNGFEYGKIYGTLVREDTQTHKVYVWDPVTNADVLIFDFSLNLNDTFRPFYNNHTITYYVTLADTVMVNGYPSKRLHLLPEYASPGDYAELTCIEGLGSLNIHPIAIWSELMKNYPNWNGVPELTCFRNNGVVPFGLGMNDSTCKAAKALNIANSKGPQVTPGIYPQPAGQSVQIVLPETTDKGTLTIYNTEGKCVFSTPLANTNRIMIDNKHNWSGLYFYRITGTTAYVGKLMFE